MQTRSFSIGEAIKLGWQKFKDQPFTWVGALILISLILGTHPFVNNWLLGNGFTFNSQNPDFMMEGNNSFIVAIVSIIYFIVQMGLSLGLLYMGLRAVDNQSLNIFHLFSRFNYVFQYIIAQFLYFLIIVAGYILLFIPGAIWASKFSLFPYFIIEHGVGPINALKMSSKTTYGAKWDIFGFILINFGLFIIGIFTLFLGFLLISPIVNIAWAFIYRKLSFEEQIVDLDFVTPSTISLNPLPPTKEI